MKRHITFLACILLVAGITTANAGIVTDFPALVPPMTDPNFFDINLSGSDVTYGFTSTLAFEIGGTDEALFDQVRNIDELTVEGATLVLNIVAPSDAVGAPAGAAEEFCPEPGDSFQIFRRSIDRRPAAVYATSRPSPAVTTRSSMGHQ